MSDLNIDSVELHPAYFWDCPRCGNENFERTVVVQVSPEEEAEMREAFGMEAWEEGNFQMMPSEVECSHCGTELLTLHSCANTDE